MEYLFLFRRNLLVRAEEYFLHIFCVDTFLQTNASEDVQSSAR